MRYIVFSDLHSNLEALNQFEKEISSIPHDRLVCLGDIVGYGADPNLCVDWVRNNVDFTLAGNHDLAVVDKTDISYFNSYAIEACKWTQKILTTENRTFLESLPMDREENGVYWVHASPYQPSRWHYIVSKKNAEKHFWSFDAPVCFVGHSHKPIILEQKPKGEINDYVANLWDIEPENRYIFNDGSLGQPRDGNTEPMYILYDSDERTVEFKRFDYDFTQTQNKIIDNGLPAYLADRLSRGK
ncbi:MAG: putative phosphodiesterase [Nitrospinales bacterium]|jgi:predicted phosphodiesterase